AIRRTHELQRQLVIGSEPWAQLGAVFETHALLASVAEPSLEQASRVLGDDVRPGLRTLRLLGQRRNSLLEDAMAALLTSNPERHSVLVTVGEQTLDLYGEFLVECCVAGFNLASWQARQLA